MSNNIGGEDMSYKESKSTFLSCCAVCGNDIKAGLCYECLNEEIEVLKEWIEELEERIRRLEQTTATTGARA